MPKPHASPEIDGDRVRELRHVAGLSGTALAEKIGITPQYLSQIERGHRPTVSAAMFNRIATALEVDRKKIRRPRRSATRVPAQDAALAAQDAA